MKRFFITVIQIVFLYGISLLGDWLAVALHLPIPGSIIGFLLLFIGLMTQIIPEHIIEEGAHFILLFLPLFFIPSTVGVIEYPELLSWNGLLLICSVIISTFITLVVVGISSERMTKATKGGEIH